MLLSEGGGGVKKIAIISAAARAPEAAKMDRCVCAAGGSRKLSLMDLIFGLADPDN